MYFYNLIHFTLVNQYFDLSSSLSISSSHSSNSSPSFLFSSLIDGNFKIIFRGRTLNYHRFFSFLYKFLFPYQNNLSDCFLLSLSIPTILKITIKVDPNIIVLFFVKRQCRSDKRFFFAIYIHLIFNESKLIKDSNNKNVTKNGQLFNSHHPSESIIGLIPLKLKIKMHI